MRRIPAKELALALAFTALAGAASAYDVKMGPLVIENPWSRATPAGAKVAVGYVAIKNTGSEPDRLVGGSSELAGRVEVHQMSVTNGVMQMRPVPDGLELKPGATTDLKPGGYHLMMMDLKRPLKEGETVKGTLTFERAGTVPVEFQVESIGARAPMQAAKP